MKCLYIVILSLTVIACNNRKKQPESIESIIKKYKKIELPNIQEDLQNSKSLKIATYINGDCSVCISELSIWKEWVIKDSCSVQFLFFFHSTDSLRLDYIIKNYFNIEYPLIYDKESKYLSINDIKKDDKMFQTFLLDKDNNVLLVGNPLLNKKLADLYKREIEKRTSKKHNLNN